MNNDQTLAQLAAQCEQRAREVQSFGDRAQLFQIAAQIRRRAMKDERPMRVVVNNEPFPLVMG